MIRRIVIINKMFYPELGGVEVTAKQIADIGQQTLPEGAIVITHNKKRNTIVENLNGIQVYRLGTWFRHDPIRLSNNKEWYKHLRQFDNGQTLFIFNFPDVQPCLSLPDLDSPKVCIYHSDLVGWGAAGSTFNKLFVGRFLRKMDRIITTSPILAQTSSILQANIDKVTIIPPGIDTDLFKPMPTNVREQWLQQLQAPLNSHIVLYVGRFGRYKGLQYLIEALQYLPDNYYIVMVGKDNDSVDKLLARSPYAKRVLQLPPVEQSQLPPLYNAADVFVLPSVDRGEAFGLVGVEAMACGIPVVTTQLGTGTSYYNIDGVTGHVVPPCHADALAEAIVDIIEHRDHYKSEAIRTRAEQFSYDKFESNIKELFTQW